MVCPAKSSADHGQHPLRCWLMLSAFGSRCGTEQGRGRKRWIKRTKSPEILRFQVILARREGFDPPAFWSVAVQEGRGARYQVLFAAFGRCILRKTSGSSIAYCLMLSAFGSGFGSGGQNILTSGLQHRNVMYQRVPYGGNVDRTIGMNIEIPRVLNDTPRDRSVPLLHLIGKLRNQFADLNHTHTAGILKKMIAFKGGKIVVVSGQIVRNTLAVKNDLTQNQFITRFDRATPPLYRSCLKRNYQRSHWSPNPPANVRHPLLPSESRRADIVSAVRPFRFSSLYRCWRWLVLLRRSRRVTRWPRHAPEQWEKQYCEYLRCCTVP